MEITLNISKETYQVLLDSLDLYGRLLMGQTSIVNEKLNRNGFYDKEENPNEVSKEIATRYFDEIDGFRSFIALSHATKNAKISIDLYATLRSESGLEAEHSVWKQKHMNHSKEQMEISFK